MMPTDEVLFEKTPPVAMLTLNRPEARNAMTWAMYDALEAACDEVDRDDSLRVFVLRGAGGKAFVAGTDIGQFTAFRTAEDALGYEARMERVVGRLEAVRKPTVAAIQGFAVGAGFVMAIACDLRVCTPDSQLGAPIARTLGNCLSLANYARVVDLLGLARAKEVIFTGRLVGASEALAVGLVNEVVPAGELEGRVSRLAQTLAANAPLTLQATKEAMRRLQAHRRAPGGEDLILTCYLSEDFQEGVRAFLEKRRPQWKGR